jgi:hypothetical protein
MRQPAMRLFPFLAVLAVAVLGLSPAQAQTPQIYGKLWFFNHSDKAVRLTIKGAGPVSIPANRILSVTLPGQLVYFTIETEGMNDIDDNHYFENFAEVGGTRWACAILDVERGEYYHPRLTYMAADSCAEVVAG